MTAFGIRAYGRLEKWVSTLDGGRFMSVSLTEPAERRPVSKPRFRASTCVNCQLGSYIARILILKCQPTSQDKHPETTDEGLTFPKMEDTRTRNLTPHYSISAIKITNKASALLDS